MRGFVVWEWCANIGRRRQTATYVALGLVGRGRSRPGNEGLEKVLPFVVRCECVGTQHSVCCLYTWAALGLSVVAGRYSG